MCRKGKGIEMRGKGGDKMAWGTENKKTEKGDKLEKTRENKGWRAERTK